MYTVVTIMNVECLFLTFNGIQRVSVDNPPLTDKTNESETTTHTYQTKHKYFLYVLVLYNGMQNDDVEKKLDHGMF